MTLPQALLLSLLLTELIELPVLALLGFRGRELVIAALANVVTNPAVVFLHAAAASQTNLPEWLVILVLEVSAVLIEALIYKKATDRKRPLLDSFIANAVSYSIGLIFTTFILPKLL